MGSGGVEMPRFEVVLPAIFAMLGLAGLLLPRYAGLHPGDIQLASELVVLAFFAHGISSLDTSLVAKFFGWLVMLALISLALLSRSESSDSKVFEWILFLGSMPWVLLEAMVVVRIALSVQPFAALGGAPKRPAGDLSYVSLTSKVRLLSWMLSIALLAAWAAVLCGLWQLYHLEEGRLASTLARVSVVCTAALTALCLTQRLRLGILFPVLIAGYELLVLSCQASARSPAACALLTLAATACTAWALHRRPPTARLWPSTPCLAQRKANRWEKDRPRAADVESQDAEDVSLLPAGGAGGGRRRQRLLAEALLRASCAAHLSTLLPCQAGLPHPLAVEVAVGLRSAALWLAAVEALRRRDAFRHAYSRWFRRFYYQPQGAGE